MFMKQNKDKIFSNENNETKLLMKDKPKIANGINIFFNVSSTTPIYLGIEQPKFQLLNKNTYRKSY